MAKYRLDELECAVFKRNPLLTSRLRSPLSDSDVKMMLKRAKVVGAIDPVIALYTWRNGTTFDQALMVSKTGFFPGAVYQFIDLEKAIEHMSAYRECVCSCFPELANLGRRYFHIFWNGATNWVGLDLDSSESRVVLIRYFIKEASFKDGQYEAEIHEKNPPREAYGSFREFIDDAIRANENNEQLACFRQDTESDSKLVLGQSEPLRDAAAPKTGADKKIIPAGENALVLRTDFSDEPTWKALCAALQDPKDDFSPSLDFVSDRAYDGVTADQLTSFLPEDSSISFAFLVDHNAITHPDHPILVIDLHDRPGRTFRVIPSALGDVANNLSIANMGFDEFVEAVEQDGIFRGFSQD